MNKNQQMIMDYLREIEEVIPKIDDWKPEIIENSPVDARAFTGTYGDWKLVIVDFDIENQGFPPGSRGYDGAASNRSKLALVHLTREVAKKALDTLLDKINQ
jgi:hypothetical protein